MLRNQTLSLVVLIASAICSTAAFAQNGQLPSNYYQGSFANNMQAIADSTYSQGQTCANGSCSKRNTSYPAATAVAAPAVSYGVYAAPQSLTVLKTIQPTQMAYYPAGISMGNSSCAASHTGTSSYRTTATTRVYYGSPVSYSSSCH